MEPPRLDLLASTTWAPGVTKQLSIHVVGHVGPESEEHSFEQGDVSLVVFDHRADGFTIPSENVEPESMRCGFLSAQPKELADVVEAVRVEHELLLRDFVRVD